MLKYEKFTYYHLSYRSYKIDMSQKFSLSPCRSTSVVNVGGGGLVDYSDSSETDDDEIPLRIKKEAEDVEAPLLDEECKVGLVGHYETVPGPDAGIAIGIPDGISSSS